MSSHFAKPENALRKGKDLVKVGKPSSALKTLHNILVARRYRLWSPTHEKIMFFYIELAVNLRRNVKDAFVQYRMICQTAQSGSMEKVMKHYQKLAEDKANEAQQKAAAAAAAAESGKPQGEQAVQAAVRDVEDLEEESPESIMLAALSGEGTKERLDRQILTPWVKYLWECYRTILDVLRNNGKLEVLYHQTARAAFDFCKRFQRNMEFRRLCEILRNHLATIQRFQNQTNAIDLNSAETQTLYLETRFQQLRMASELELWQEAYRTIEDIHENLKVGARVEPPPELMKTYYEKLSQIFWASSNFLFHAYSLHKYYALSAQEALSAGAAPAAAESSSAITTAPLNAEGRSKLASAVVLSALIISGNKQSTDLHDIDAITGVEHEGNMRLAQLLGFKKESPSRQRILQAVQASGVLTDASDLSKNIFRLLETQFGPLTLYAQLKPLLEQLRADPDLSKYVQPLEQLTILRVLQQLSTVFKSMKIDKFIPLVPDIGSIFALERLIMSGITSDLLNLRFDHRSMTLIFPESDLESPQLKDQLVVLSRNFISLAHTLESTSASAQTQTDKIKERNHVFKLIQANLLEEHENVFLRQELIEKRKQELEKILIDKEKKEAEAKAAAIQQRRAEEQRRLAEESARREEDRRRKENAERELRTKQAMAEEMKKKIDAVTAQSSIVGGKTALKAEKKIQALTQDLENIDKVQLMRAQEEILRAQQREIERRRKESARRIDYTVRAMRLEERALLLAKMESNKIDEREQFEADFAKYLEQDKINHAKAVAEKERLIARMSREKNIFHEKLMARRTEAFKIEKDKQDERLAIKAEKRRVAEERRRKEEEQREKEKAIQAEKERLRREEEERQEALAAMERKRKEEERQEKIRLEKEAKDKQNEIVQARLKREEEAEAKERERRAATRTTTGERPGWGRPSAAAPAGATAAAGGEERRPEPRSQDERFPVRRNEDVRRSDDAPFRREERPAGGDRDRDFGSMRRPAGSEDQERRPERNFDDVRSRPGPAGGDAPAPRWGANRDGPRDAPRGDFNRDAPRGGDFNRGPPGGNRFGDRDAPRFGGDRDAPRGGDRDAPRDFGRDGPSRDGPSREDRFGGPRAGAGGDREPPSREAFGSRGGQDVRPGQGGYGARRDDRDAPPRQERDFGSMRSGAGAGPSAQGGAGGFRGGNDRDAPRGGDFRRRDDAPAPAAREQPAAQPERAQEAAPASGAPADDGFTQVKKASRR